MYSVSYSPTRRPCRPCTPCIPMPPSIGARAYDAINRSSLGQHGAHRHRLGLRKRSREQCFYVEIRDGLRSILGVPQRCEGTKRRRRRRRRRIYRWPMAGTRTRTVKEGTGDWNRRRVWRPCALYAPPHLSIDVQRLPSRSLHRSTPCPLSGTKGRCRVRSKFQSIVSLHVRGAIILISHPRNSHLRIDSPETTNTTIPNAAHAIASGRVDWYHFLPAADGGRCLKFAPGLSGSSTSSTSTPPPSKSSNSSSPSSSSLSPFGWFTSPFARRNKEEEVDVSVGIEDGGRTLLLSDESLR